MAATVTAAAPVNAPTAATATSTRFTLLFKVNLPEFGGEGGVAGSLDLHSGPSQMIHTVATAPPVVHRFDHDGEAAFRRAAVVKWMGFRDTDAGFVS